MCVYGGQTGAITDDCCRDDIISHVLLLYFNVDHWEGFFVVDLHQHERKVYRGGAVLTSKSTLVFVLKSFWSAAMEPLNGSLCKVSSLI
jgi:hypothetical protein